MQYLSFHYQILLLCILRIFSIKNACIQYILYNAAKEKQEQKSIVLRCPVYMNRGGFRGGGVSEGCNPPPPPNGQSHCIKCSTTNVLRYAQALIYTAKSLVVVVVSSKQVVKPLSRQVVVQPKVLHLLECLLGHSTVLELGSTR